MSRILYDFAANNALLEEISMQIHNIEEVRADINRVFALLGEVYEGDGATALRAKQSKIDVELEDVLIAEQTAQREALEKQEAMHALDRGHAGAI